jgi:hypothetical protein
MCRRLVVRACVRACVCVCARLSAHTPTHPAAPPPPCELLRWLECHTKGNSLYRRPVGKAEGSLLLSLSLFFLIN